MPDVSIIVPIYNCAPYLRACIEGILAQRMEDVFEVLAVDNNSTDGCAEIVRAYPQVTLFCEHKQGAYAARNLGIRQSRGKYLVFLDADCVPEAGWLSSLYEAIRRPGVWLAKGCVRHASERAPLNWLADFDRHRDERIFGGHERSFYYGDTANMAVAREAFDRFGYFEERLRGSDMAFTQVLVHALSCDAAVFVNDAVVRHLEVGDLTSYCRKMYIYGHTREDWKPALPIRSLPLAQRFAAYRFASRASGRPAAARVGLLACLGLGSAAWAMGSVRRRLLRTAAVIY